jgi:hypothetical protein
LAAAEQAVLAAVVVAEEAEPAPPAASSSSVYPFLSHFHLLGQLMLTLDVGLLQRLIAFLDPEPGLAAALELQLELEADEVAAEKKGGAAGGASATPSANGQAASAADSSSPATTTSGGGGGSGMSLCFRLLDAPTQLQLIELLLHCMLQHKQLLDKHEIDERRATRGTITTMAPMTMTPQQEGAAAAAAAVTPSASASSASTSAGEGETHSSSAGEGSGETSSSTSSSSASLSHNRNRTPPPRTPALLAQLRLLHLLRAYSGQYRLAHILPRCVDYRNWIAAAVAMESRPVPAAAPSSIAPAASPAATTAAAASASRAGFSGAAAAFGRVSATTLLCSGAEGHINPTQSNLALLADAMEARLKHIEQRLHLWRRWKDATTFGSTNSHQGAESNTDTGSTQLNTLLGSTEGPATLSSLSMPLLVDGLLPPLPAAVWLSFDRYAVASGEMLLQLVLTHLVPLGAHFPSEQAARLIASLMRAWRGWDLPALVLESIFLANLPTLADALVLLAFQPQNKKQTQQQQQQQPHTLASAAQNNSSHNFSTDGKVVGGGGAAGSAGSATALASLSSSSQQQPQPAAPIFSAKLYLALTHYRLHAIYRQCGSGNASSGGSVIGASGSGACGSRSTTSAAVGGDELLFSSSRLSVPSSGQLNRLWTEILANLSRDLGFDGASGGSGGNKINGSGVGDVLSAGNAGSGSNDTDGKANTLPGVIVFSGLQPPPPSVQALDGVGSGGCVSSSPLMGGGGARASFSVAISSASSTGRKDLSSLISASLSAASSPSSSSSSIPGSAGDSHTHSALPRSLVVFSCGHSFSTRDFCARAVPELLAALARFEPPIPITAKLLQEEYSGATAEEEHSHLTTAAQGNHQAFGATSSAAAKASRGRVMSLACPSCVLSTLSSEHRKLASERASAAATSAARRAQQAALQAAAHEAYLAARMQQQQAEEAAAAAAAAAGISPRLYGIGLGRGSSNSSAGGSSRSLTPTLQPNGASPPTSRATTTMALLQSQQHSYASSSHSSSGASGHPSRTNSPPSQVPSPSPSHASQAGAAGHAHGHAYGHGHTPAPSPRHQRVGLSLSGLGMLPKVMFGRVSQADIEASQ